MKFAGIARTLVLVALGALLLAAPAGAATQGVTPLRATIGDDFESAFDGTDIYWTMSRALKRVPKYGYTSTTSLMRSSFLDGSKTVLKRFDPSDTATGFPEDIFAGGGYVYVNMSGDGPERDEIRSSSSVLRMSRDGSNFQKIASGQLNAGEEDAIVRLHGNKGQLNDCGTDVSAEHVAGDGSVVIREATADRESKACGRKKNVDHVRIYLLSPTGVTREILKEDLRVTLTIRRHKDGSWSSETGSKDPATYVAGVVGDRALLVRGRRSLSYYVRDLNTGTQTGPFKAAITSTYPFNLGSLDPEGRVAVSTFAVTGSKKHRKIRHSSGVFQVPGDTASFRPVKGFSFLMFCGKHLISLSSRGVRELDPVTFNLIRPISPPHKDGSIVDINNACTADYLYMSRSRSKGSKQLAYPLD